MAWTDYNNGLFSRSDFDTTRFGGSGNDQVGPKLGFYLVDPAPGDDYLEGNRGTDTLNGWGGNDVLVGVDPDYYDAGAGEYDCLNGGGGYDTFVLGDIYETYYQGNGYAIIEDFDRSQDMLAAHGSSSDYTFTTSSNVIGDSANDTILKYKGDWVAVFEDTTVSLNGGDFDFL